MSDEPHFTLTLEHLTGYEFRLKFDWPELTPLTLDEPAPLGTQHGPNAARLIAAGVANCLSASLLFCLNKSHATPRSVKTTVTGKLTRNDKGRLRVGGIDVSIALDLDTEHAARLARCSGLFEDYCVVTESVRQGIPVNVRIVDGKGDTIYQG
jgi:organic hydroperoxide reductase OsmC/OhrA